MKATFGFVVIVLTALMALCAANCSLAGERSGGKLRWDLLMIREARVWKNLLVNYPYADQQKYWPQRKAALQVILNEYPGTRWADDAALILACGKASYEGNTPGAIADLNKVARQYPDGHTIVAEWFPDDGCMLDETWLRIQGGLVYLNPDGTIRKAFPFDRNGEIHQTEKEALAYFAHLDKYPRRTQVVARYFKAKILADQGERAKAISVLEQLLSRSQEYLAKAIKADRSAASRSDGFHLRCLMRPEYYAYFELAGYYEKEGYVEKAIQKVDEFAALLGRAGGNWKLNEMLAAYYNSRGLRTRAKHQYEIAAKGLRKHIKYDQYRDTLVEELPYPRQPRSFLEEELTRIQKTIAAYAEQ